MKFNVLKQELIIDHIRTIASDTKDYLEAYFDFSCDWEGLKKYAHFKKVNDETNYIIELIDDKITKDKHLNLSKGDWLIWVHGDRFDSNTVEERITTTIVRINVKQTGAINGEIFPEIPLGDVERLEAEIYTEAQTRHDEDELLQKQIDKLGQQYLSFVTKDELSEESQQRQMIDGNLAKAITEEMEFRVCKDNELLSEIDNNKNSIAFLTNSKANKSETYTKTEIDYRIEQATPKDYDEVKQQVAINKANIENLSSNKADKSNTYTKEEVDNLIKEATPEDYDEVKIQVATNKSSIETIESYIPSQATSTNQLADKEFVNSSIATNTATFIGTFNSVEELEAYEGTKTNNDYAFVVINDETTGFVKEYDRYKWNGTEWLFEYSLNNSSFTAEQWATINSGITAEDIEALQNGKQDTITDLETIRSGATKGATAIQNIKTVNNQSLLGTGNITLDTGKVDDVKVNGTSVVTNKIANISTTVVTMRKW